MRKTSCNYYGLQEEPAVMFRKVMQVDDDVIFRFFQLLSRRSSGDIAALQRDKSAGRNPLEIKGLFAREMLERFHGPEAADRAAREFERVYAKGAVPEDLKMVVVSVPTDTVWVSVALRLAGLAPSTSAANAVITQGGVELDGKTISDFRHPLHVGEEHVVRVGSKNRRFARIKIEKKE